MKIVFLLLCFAFFNSVTANKLELHRCRTSRKTEAKINLRPENVIGSELMRSNTECVIACYNKDGCTATAWEDTRGTCTLMVRVVALNTDEPYVKAFITNLLVDTSTGVCADDTCSEGSYCTSECHPDLGTIAVCVQNNEDCDMGDEYMNIRHYYGDIYTDSTDNGIIQTQNYEKMRSDTLLRVIYHALFRGHYQNAGQCTRWWFSFNDAECTSPDTIDLLDYSANTGNMHRSNDMDGSCGGLDAGTVKVDIRIGACPGYGVVDGSTGWSNNRQLIIMEILPQKLITVKPCPGLTTFNYYYHTNREYVGIHGHNQVVQTIVYQKLASDTSLRIKYNANTRIQVLASDKYYCGRWWFRIGGTDCSPIGDYVIHAGHGHYAYHRNPHRHKTLEAICEGIAAGNHKIEVVTGQCYYSQTEPSDFRSGWQSPSRMMVEEVRLGQTTEAVYNSAVQKVLRNPFFNVVRQHYHLMNLGTDSGTIKTFTYIKSSPHSALRLTSSGDHRTIYGSGWQPCSRWYFTIDSSECSNPGGIEGTSYFNYDTNFHHPMQVSGICLGVTAGSHTIGYHIGNCHGYSGVAEGLTGWGSSFHLIVEEVHLESSVKCTNGKPMNCNT